MATKKEEVQTGASIDQYVIRLDEFCADLSKTDRRVELIGGFHNLEKRNGTVRDTRTAYAARYQAFINAPA